MKIKINKDYRLDTDSRQWIVKKYIGLDKEGNEKWKPISYFTSPEQAIKSLADRMIRESDANDFIEATKSVNEVVSIIKAALSPQINVEVKT